jgi:hypothetical protein
MDYKRTRKAKNRRQKTNEVKDILCGKKIKPINLQWKVPANSVIMEECVSLCGRIHI